MDSIGGESWMRKVAEEDSETAEIMSKVQSRANHLMGKAVWSRLPRMEKLMKQREAMVRDLLSREALPRKAREKKMAIMEQERRNLRKFGKERNMKLMSSKVRRRPKGSLLDRSDSFIQKEAEIELAMRSEMMKIREGGDYFCEAIMRALHDVKDKMAKKKTDDGTLLLILLLLQGISDRLDQGSYEEKNEIDRGKSATDQACLDTIKGMDTTMVKSDIGPAADPSSATNSVTIVQAEILRQRMKDLTDNFDTSMMSERGKSATDQACLDTIKGMDTTMVKSDIGPAADPSSATNSVTIVQAEETLQQRIKGLTENFDTSMMGERGKSATDQACLDTIKGMDMTMVKSDIGPAADPSSATNSVTIVQAETLRQMIKDFTDNFDTSMISERGKSAAEKTKADEEEEMSYEKKEFAEYRRVWEAVWGKTCGLFEHMTALSSMQFTYYTPGCTPLNSSASTPETLQIFSIKLAEIAGGLGWPLSVYGFVAVRDVVDHNRNYIFYRYRGDSQELTQDDPFLRLIGPSRAVVYTDRINIEIQLKVKGPTESQDKALITEGRNCGQVFGPGASTYCVRNRFCNIEFCVETVRSTTQATILGVQVNSGFKWPFKYGARVACSSLRGKLVVTKNNRVTLVTDPASGEVVMVDSKDGAKLKGADGYLQLPRSVISVEDDGRLDVDIQAYSESGVIAAKDHVSFRAKLSKITRKKCFLGGVEMVITVAWSQVPEEASIFWPY